MLQVHKFGGTCVATAERITDAAEHIIAVHREAGDQQMVVVSAMGSHPSSPLKVMHSMHRGRTVDEERHSTSRSEAEICMSNFRLLFRV